MYLVDTNIVSAGSPTLRSPPANFVDWMDRHTARLYISVITLTEIVDGIAMARRRGASRKAAVLDDWFATLVIGYAHRILPIDVPVARLAGELTDRARGLGIDPGLADIAIAATATRHRLTLLTRNERHFAHMGIAMLNPFEAALPEAPSESWDDFFDSPGIGIGEPPDDPPRNA